MSDFPEEEKEEIIENCTLIIHTRSKDTEEYKARDGTIIHQVINPSSTSISWTFPDGSSSLDKVVVDGKEFTSEVHDMMFIDTGVKEGSVIAIFNTLIDDEEEDN